MSDDLNSGTVNRATAPKAANAGVYHLQLKPGDVPPYVILPGAPERTLKIARDWTDVKEVASYREYKTVSGKYKDMFIAATSTGRSWVRPCRPGRKWSSAPVSSPVSAPYSRTAP